MEKQRTKNSPIGTKQSQTPKTLLLALFMVVLRTGGTNAQHQGQHQLAPRTSDAAASYEQERAKIAAANQQTLYWPLAMKRSSPASSTEEIINVNNNNVNKEEEEVEGGNQSASLALKGNTVAAMDRLFDYENEGTGGGKGEGEGTRFWSQPSASEGTAASINSNKGHDDNDDDNASVNDDDDQNDDVDSTVELLEKAAKRFNPLLALQGPASNIRSFGPSSPSSASLMANEDLLVAAAAMPWAWRTRTRRAGFLPALLSTPSFGGGRQQPLVGNKATTKRDLDNVGDGGRLLMVHPHSLVSLLPSSALFAPEHGGADEVDALMLESSMGKRSMAVGRTGFRPGKKRSGILSLSSASAGPRFIRGSRYIRLCPGNRLCGGDTKRHQRLLG